MAVLKGEKCLTPWKEKIVRDWEIYVVYVRGNVQEECADPDIGSGSGGRCGATWGIGTDRFY